MAAFKLLGTHTHTRTHTHTHTYFVLTHTRARANTQKYLILAKRRLQTHNSSHVVLYSSRMLTFALNYACPPKTCTAKHLPRPLAECVYMSCTFIAITLCTCTLPYMLHLPYAHNDPHTHTHVFAQKTQKCVLRCCDSLFIVDELDSSFRLTFSKVVKSQSMI